jgi:hypothetical protein
MTITIGDKAYRLTFQHFNTKGKTGWMHPEAPRYGIGAITVCTVTCIAASEAILYDVADFDICSKVDQFSKEKGRERALRKLIKHCGALREVEPALMAAYLGKQKPKPALRLAKKLTEEEKAALIAAGAEIREKRKAGIWTGRKARGGGQ